MKKFIYVLCLIMVSFTFTACPFYFDNLDNHKFMTPEELVAKMNQNFDTHFTLKDSEEVIKIFDNETTDYKYLVVTLEADDLPGKDVKCYQVFKYSLVDEEDLLDISKSYNASARVLCNFVEEYLLTDYYFIKYKDDLFTIIKDAFNPLLEKLNENEDYLLAVKPNIFQFQLENLQYATNVYKDATDILQRTSLKINLLIHTENYPTEEEINSFIDSIDEVFYPFFIQGYVYYSSKYSSAEVSTEALINDNFYNKTDIENKLVEQYLVF